MNKTNLSTLKIIALILIILDSLNIVDNSAGLVIFLTVYSYQITANLISEYLLEKKKITLVLQNNFLNYYASFILILSAILIISYFQNFNLNNQIETLFIPSLVLVTHAKYLSVISFIAIALSYNIMLSFIFILMKNKFKSFNVFYIFTLILLIVSIISSIVLNYQFIYYLAPLLGSFLYLTQDNLVSSGAVTFFKKSKIFGVLIYILLVILLIITSNIIILSLVIITFLILIESAAHKLFKLKIIDDIASQLPIYVLSLYSITNLLVINENQGAQSFLISSVLVLISYVITQIIYYLIYIPITRNFKFKYITYILVIITVVAAFYIHAKDNKNPNDKYSINIIEKYNLLSQDLDLLINVSHETYETAQTQSNIKNKKVIYIGDETGVEVQDVLKNSYPNVVVDVNENYKLDDIETIAEKYTDKNDGNTIFVIDLHLESNDYNKISYVSKTFDKDDIFFVTNKNEESLNTLLKRAEVETDNITVIDFEDLSSEYKEYYINDTTELTTIGKSSYVNSVYLTINEQERE